MPLNYPNFHRLIPSTNHLLPGIFFCYRFNLRLKLRHKSKRSPPNLTLAIHRDSWRAPNEQCGSYGKRGRGVLIRRVIRVHLRQMGQNARGLEDIYTTRLGRRTHLPKRVLPSWDVKLYGGGLPEKIGFFFLSNFVFFLLPDKLSRLVRT